MITVLQEKRKFPRIFIEWFMTDFMSLFAQKDVSKIDVKFDSQQITV